MKQEPAYVPGIPALQGGEDVNYSDRIVVMHEGMILADGTPAAIRANPLVASTLLGSQ